jgi:hypothetical protein
MGLLRTSQAQSMHLRDTKLPALASTVTLRSEFRMLVEFMDGIQIYGRVSARRFQPEFIYPPPQFFLSVEEAEEVRMVSFLKLPSNTERPFSSGGGTLHRGQD